MPLRSVARRRTNSKALDHPKQVAQNKKPSLALMGQISDLRSRVVAMAVAPRAVGLAPAKSGSHRWLLSFRRLRVNCMAERH